MMIDNMYILVYIICNMFRTYIIYRYMNIFFDRTITAQKTVKLSYFTYFFITTLNYIFMPIPTVMLLVNILCFIFISLNYESYYKKRLVSIGYIYIILMVTETITVLLMGYFEIDISEPMQYPTISAQILVTFINYLICVLLERHQYIKEDKKMPLAYWTCITVVPIFSIYLVLLLLSMESQTVVVIGMMMLLGLNIAVFYLYNCVMEMITEVADKMIIKRQNNYYEKQLEVIQSSIDITRGIKHDINNHLLVIQLLAKQNQVDKLIKHITNITDVYKEQDRYVNSGNIIIDSIVNFKIQEAAQKEIALLVELMVPEEMSISSFDMTTILSNILDNAIKAVDQLEEERIIDLAIKYDKGRLMINTKNKFKGKILKENGKIVTSHIDKDNHGLGLQNVSDTIKKYNGILDIGYQDNVFQVAILVYV